MLSTILWGSVIVVGSAIYVAFNGNDAVSSEKNAPEYDNIKATEKYFGTLTLDEQEKYFSDNYDLRYYKDDSTCGLTDDKYYNAKHASEIARRTGKSFTNKYKSY